MAFSIKDEATDAVVRRLAKLKKKSLTDTVREAAEHEYQRVQGDVPLIDRLGRLAERYKTFAAADAPADKPFFDKLSDDL